VLPEATGFPEVNVHISWRLEERTDSLKCNTQPLWSVAPLMVCVLGIKPLDSRVISVQNGKHATEDTGIFG